MSSSLRVKKEVVIGDQPTGDAQDIAATDRDRSIGNAAPSGDGNAMVFEARPHDFKAKARRHVVEQTTHHCRYWIVTRDRPRRFVDYGIDMRAETVWVSPNPE